MQNQILFIALGATWRQITLTTYERAAELVCENGARDFAAKGKK